MLHVRQCYALLPQAHSDGEDAAINSPSKQPRTKGRRQLERVSMQAGTPPGCGSTCLPACFDSTTADAGVACPHAHTFTSMSTWSPSAKTCLSAPRLPLLLAASQPALMGIKDDAVLMPQLAAAAPHQIKAHAEKMLSRRLNVWAPSNVVAFW